MSNELSALDAIRLATAGVAVFGRASYDRMSTWELAWYVREESKRIAALGPAPEVEFRAGVFELPRVRPIPILVRVGPETPESVYETWLNIHAPGLRDSLDLLAAQPRLSVILVGDTGASERSLEISNRLADFARQARERLAGVPAWSMAEFDAARAKAEQEFASVWKLWQALKSACR